MLGEFEQGLKVADASGTDVEREDPECNGPLGGVQLRLEMPNVSSNVLIYLGQQVSGVVGQTNERAALVVR